MITPTCYVTTPRKHNALRLCGCCPCIFQNHTSEYQQQLWVKVQNLHFPRIWWYSGDNRDSTRCVSSVQNTHTHTHRVTVIISESVQLPELHVQDTSLTFSCWCALSTKYVHEKHSSWKKHKPQTHQVNNNRSVKSTFIKLTFVLLSNFVGGDLLCRFV